jgi:hypothetical protein
MDAYNGQPIHNAARLAICSTCVLCERFEQKADPWSRCRACNRKGLWEFLDNPLAWCPAAKWHAECKILSWNDSQATIPHGIVIGSDDQAADLADMFIRYLRKKTASTLPIWCADFGLTKQLPVDGTFQVTGQNLHPIYRKPLAAMQSPFEWGVWFDTDILVRIDPKEILTELEKSGQTFAARQSEMDWRKTHRNDSRHTGVFAWHQGSEVLQRWASLAIHGSAVWITAEDVRWQRDEELFNELLRITSMPVHSLAPHHCKLPSEFNPSARSILEVAAKCGSENWHFPGPANKHDYRSIATSEL